MASNSFFESLVLLWEEWELRLLVLMSLILQIILIGLGNRRMYSAGNKIAFVLWLTYLSADWFAAICLGILLRSQVNCNDTYVDLEYVIIAFWAPFLLLHLGGPDTITAYSLEDNELWFRHMLVLIYEVVVALYIFVRSMKPTQLNFLAIPIFVAGLIKYGERTWVLRSASREQFRTSLLPVAETSLPFKTFLQDLKMKICEGYDMSKVALEERMATPVDPAIRAVGSTHPMEEDKALAFAYKFFLISRRLFTGLVLSSEDIKDSQSFFQACTWTDAFKVIEMELGFMYAVLFTKATCVHPYWICVLRLISFSSTAAALIAFCLIDLSSYSSVNVIISLILLVGAIGLEVCSIFLHLSSDWTMFWIYGHNNEEETRGRLISCLHFCLTGLHSFRIKKRWSNCVMQHNLLSSCFKNPTVSDQNKKHLKWIYKQLEKYRDDQVVQVSDSLKEKIFEKLLEKSQTALDPSCWKMLSTYRGQRALQKHHRSDLHWSIEKEFDRCIIMWHIATDLRLPYSDNENLHGATDFQEVTRVISNYMLFILTKRPFVLPDGIGQIRLQDTYADVEKFIRDDNIMSRQGAAQELLGLECSIPFEDVNAGECKSVLFDACRLAGSLQLQEEDQINWEMIMEVWLEMLCYAASRCQWIHHGQQLRRGGELLTHVWILMTHLGITEQFHISVGDARNQYKAR